MWFGRQETHASGQETDLVDPGDLSVTRDSMHRAGGQTSVFKPSTHKAVLRRQVTGRTGGRQQAGTRDLEGRPGGSDALY